MLLLASALIAGLLEAGGGRGLSEAVDVGEGAAESEMWVGGGLGKAQDRGETGVRTFQ